MNINNQNKKPLNSKKTNINQKDSSFENIKNKKNVTQNQKKIPQTQKLKVLKIVQNEEKTSTTIQKNINQINITNQTINSEPMYKTNTNIDFQNIIAFENELSNPNEKKHSIKSNLNNQSFNNSINNTNNYLITKYELINHILNQKMNLICFDCRKKSPKYISINNAIFLCQNCAKIHKKIFPEKISLNYLKIHQKIKFCCLLININSSKIIFEPTLWVFFYY